MESAVVRFGPPEDWAQVAKAERAAFDRQRLDHIASFAIWTPRMTWIHDQLQSLVEANYSAFGPRPGAVIDSVAGGYGKTWAATLFGRWYERQLRALSAGRRVEIPGANDRFAPVLYIALRDGSATAHIDEQMLRSFNAIIPRGPQRHLTARVAEEAEAADTSVVIVDDINKLRRWLRDDVAIADHLNHLQSAISATFIYAGIDCEASGVFDEGSASGLFGAAATTSTQARFMHLKIEKFDLDGDWQALLRQFEEELVLMKNYPGMLCEDLAEYIFERTDGTIAAVSQLLRRGAVDAIRSGTEAITEALLDRTHLAIAAETARRSRGTAGADGKAASAKRKARKRRT